MAKLPLHKAIQMADCGIFLKEISPFSQEGGAIEYAHRDDYYIFGLVNNGGCAVNIDFKEHRLSGCQAICIQPGQVHASVRSTAVKAYILGVDGLFISDICRHSIDEYALHTSPIPMDSGRQSELERLFSILSGRIGDMGNDVSKEIVRCLSCSIIGIIAEAIQNADYSQGRSKRHVDITLKFRKLLQQQLHENRSPSHYAKSLHISPAYLNEVVNGVMGMSAGKFIRSEIVLRAKRLLFYTDKNVQQIAGELGFEDAAYFTKLFSKATGISPTLFRLRYLG